MRRPGNHPARRHADEQAALRRVATHVAEGTPGHELFATVAREVSNVFGVGMVTLDRFDPDGHSTVLASLNDPAFPVGSRWPLDGPSLAATVFETARAARIDDYTGLSGTIAAAARSMPLACTVGVPIVVGGSVWGIICVGTRHPPALPPDTEQGLTGFTELLATAIANTEARDVLLELAREQAALRRVATLVAQGTGAAELFAAVVEEVAGVVDAPTITLDRYETDGTTTVVGAWGDDNPFPLGTRWPLDGTSLSSKVLETGRALRIDDYSSLDGTIAGQVRGSAITSTVGVPIIVDGRVWGLICVGAKARERLAPETEFRLRDFTELVGTAISDAEARDDLRRLAADQASLRRIATLVAQGAPAGELFTAVTEAVSLMIGFRAVTLDRYDTDASTTVLASLDPTYPTGSRWPLDGPSVAAEVLRTGRSARIDDYSALSGSIAAAARTGSLSSVVGVPIVVDGKVWGVICVGTQRDLLLADTEARLRDFIELLATAISNRQARDDVRSLADEQASLRRVATLVARERDSQTIFDEVCAEAGRLVDAVGVELVQFTADDLHVPVAAWSSTGAPRPTEACRLIPGTIEAAIRVGGAPLQRNGGEPGPPQRPGITWEMGAPVIVEGGVWGALVATGAQARPLRAAAEEQIARFTELVATAVLNASTRAALIDSRARIVAAGDEARRRIERNLRDGTQQQLIGLGLDLQRLRASVPGGDEELCEGLDRLGVEVESVLEDVRELSRGLHPALLARGGLRPSVRALARRSPIPVALYVDPGPRPQQPVETGAYYVISEGLTNAARYSEASGVAVAVTQGNGMLRVTIDDDGVGGAAATPGSGLAGLVDRVEALGGLFGLHSPPGGGTHISIALPLDY